MGGKVLECKYSFSFTNPHNALQCWTLSKDAYQVERAEDSDSDNSQLHSRTTSINGRMRSSLHQCQPKDKSAAEDGRNRAEVFINI